MRLSKLRAAGCLFSYGTLMFPQVMRAVTGAVYPRRAAKLHGYACHRLRGEIYPGIIAQAGGEVSGCVWSGIDAAAWRLIDAYEGEGYERRLLEVDGGPGMPLRAWGYVMSPASRDRLEAGDWDRDEFECRHLAGWLRALRAHE